MSIQIALMTLGEAFAEQGVDGDMELRLGPHAYAAVQSEFAGNFKFLPRSDPPNGREEFAVLTAAGRIRIPPPARRFAKCEHGIPSDYCTPCGAP